MSAPQMTTAEALRTALASTIACSAQELQDAVGRIVVATSAECPDSGSDVRSLSDPHIWPSRNRSWFVAAISMTRMLS